MESTCPRIRMVFLNTILLIVLSQKICYTQINPYLLYACENCEIRNYYKLKHHQILLYEDKIRLFNRQNLQSDQLDQLPIQRLFIENDTTFHAMSSIFYIKFIIRQDRLTVSKIILIPPDKAAKMGYNAIELNNSIIGTQFSDRKGPKYLRTPYDHLEFGSAQEVYALFPPELYKRSSGIKAVASIKKTPQTLFSWWEGGGQKRRKKATNLYDYAIIGKRLYLFDLHSNRFFVFNDNLRLASKITLPAQVDWRYFYDHISGKHYFLKEKKKVLELYFLNMDRKELELRKVLQSGWVSNIYDDQVIYLQEEKDAYEVLALPLEESPTSKGEIWKIDIEEVIIEQSENN